MTAPVLRAITESGQTWDDPSEQLLFELLGDMERGDEEFLIVERTADASGQTYVQVALAPETVYQVEYRDGGPDQHYQAFTEDKQQVHDVITRWAFDRPGWREALPWAPLVLDA